MVIERQANKYEKEKLHRPCSVHISNTPCSRAEIIEYAAECRSCTQAPAEKARCMNTAKALKQPANTEKIITY